MSFLSPKSIAVIGASADAQKVGHIVLKNLKEGFGGKIFPINPKADAILGLKTHPSVTVVKDTIDLAVIVTPAATVPGILEECAKKHIHHVVVISAGFGEMGTKDGEKLEEDVTRICKDHDINMIGPNCLGLMRPALKMNASFGALPKTDGSIALLSQSGAFAVAVLDGAESLNLGFSLVVSMGNKTMMDECDFLKMCLEDEETHVIGIYVENIKDGRKFLNTASEVCAKKPIVLIKSGTSERGKRAVSSHTGALAGSDAAIDAVCAQTGIRRARTTEEFLDVLRALSSQPALLSPHIAVITNAGGPGILATDAAERSRLILAELEPKNADALKKILPGAASVKNPIDVLGDALAERYEEALKACGKDPNIDGVVALLTPQVMTPCEEIAKAVVAVHKKYPLMPIVTSFMGEKNIRAATEILHENGIPNYSTPERAVAALAALQKKELGVRKLAKLKIPNFLIPNSSRGLLSEKSTHDLFSHYGLPLPSSAVARSENEAMKLAEHIGFPVVAKISSPDILHKTDIGGVKVNVKNEDDARKAFIEIQTAVKKNAPKARVNGVLIQKFLPAGDEFIVGAIKDPNFGHLIMCGLGGIYTELFRDTAFRIAPIDEKEAFAMLQELRSWKMLLGMRGKAQSDIAALSAIIAKVSKLVSENPQISELDLNPVIVRSDGVTIADAKVIID